MMQTQKALMKYKIVKDNRFLFLDYAISNSRVFSVFKIINMLTIIGTSKVILRKCYKF